MVIGWHAAVVSGSGRNLMKKHQGVFAVLIIVLAAAATFTFPAYSKDKGDTGVC